MIFRKCYGQLYSHKFNNLEEMDQFLKNHKLSKLIQDETDQVTSPITVKETEFLVKKFQKKEIPRPDLLH